MKLVEVHLQYILAKSYSFDTVTFHLELSETSKENIVH